MNLLRPFCQLTRDEKEMLLQDLIEAYREMMHSDLASYEQARCWRHAITKYIVGETR